MDYISTQYCIARENVDMNGQWGQLIQQNIHHNS